MTDATIAPTPEQQQRAKWDLLLLDIEHRTEQLRQMKGYAPLDIEYRTEQLRQIKSYEPRRLLLQAVTASAALLGGGAALGALVTALLQR
jgi:hypothetical protein